MKKTIVALASAPGRSGVAVLRVSGPDARAVFPEICRQAEPPEPRRAVLRALKDPKTGELIDRALVLWFPAPRSFTGEDMAELHLHGGRATVAAALAALCSLDDFRPAEPGEYTRRAFENGKMDLTEAEGLADLIDAETTAQRRQALRQMDGALGRLYGDWAERLKKALAFIEAEIDFADEELPPEIAAERLEAARLLEKEIAAHLNDARRGEKIREGFFVALLGAPNAGKSSLLNALSKREAAIVAETPGTTRDAIEVHLDLGGYPVTLVDTAGLRETKDVIETEGVRRARARAEQADFKLLLFDGTRWPEKDAETAALEDENALVVVTRKDALAEAKKAEILASGASLVSNTTGDGLAALTARLIEEIDRRFVGEAAPALTRQRHRTALEETLSHLRRALIADGAELCAEDLRLALRSLGRITGRVDVEDLLDVIFSEFCIGK